MSIIHAENFDGSSSLPVGWQDSTGSTYSISTGYGGVTPTSSPNLLLATAGSTAFFSWTTLDGDGGDVEMSANLAGVAASGAPGEMGVTARGQFSGGNFNAYLGWLDRGGTTVGISLWDSGTEVGLASLVVSAPIGTWTRAYLKAVGTSLSLYVQDHASGQWLATSGAAWQAAQVACLTATDSTISGQGYSGLYVRPGLGVSFYGLFDDTELDTATGPAPVPLVPISRPSLARDASIRDRAAAVRPAPSAPFAPQPPPAPPVVLPFAAPPSGRPAPPRTPSPAAIAAIPRPASPPNAVAAPARASRRTATIRGLSREVRPDPPPVNPPPPPPATPLVAALGSANARLRSRQAARSATSGAEGTPSSAPVPPSPSPTPTKGGLGLGSCGCCSPECDCVARICVVGCGGGGIQGAIITVLDGSGSVLGRCTTTQDNNCCSPCIGAAGSYTVEVTAPGYDDYSASLSLSCGGTTTITLTPTGTTPPCIGWWVYGCCNLDGGQTYPLAGATITVAGGPTLTTDANGFASWCGPAAAGSYPFTVSASRYADFTGTISDAGCSYQGNTFYVNLQPASGYYCGPGTAPANNRFPSYPVPATLHLTDSRYGSTTLAYDPSVPGWVGTLSADFPGGCGCPASPFEITYFLGACGTDLGFSMAPTVVKYGFPLMYSGYGTCPGCVYYGYGSLCPSNQVPAAASCNDLTACGFYGDVCTPIASPPGVLGSCGIGLLATSYTIATTPPFSFAATWAFALDGNDCPTHTGLPYYVEPTITWLDGVTITITE